MLEQIEVRVPAELDIQMNKQQLAQSREKALNDTPGYLKYYECDVCKNKGAVFEVAEDGTVSGRACRCMKKRRSLQRIAQSGLQDTMTRYTMQAFQADNKQTSAIKQAAMRYIIEQKGWFFICGRPGSGKTHICTAICSELLTKHDRELRYMLWREAAPRLKALVNDRELYEEQISNLKSVDVLYIDDFLKGNVTDADVNLAFELLNARYNAANKLTIISTEKTIEAIINIDEAVGSRIYERAKEYCLRAPEANRRLE